MQTRTRLAIDIGGTFTDVALEVDAQRFTSKVLTTPAQPEQGFLEGVNRVLEQAGIAAGDVDFIVHGTTLATNALIERKGARVALLGTAGFRDVIEIAYEHRFDQSDVFMERPAPLVPRYHRHSIPERIAADGSVLVPLGEAAVRELVPTLVDAGIEAVAVGYLHSYVNPAHEIRTREIIREYLPQIPISISSEVSPEIREYDRLSTTVANAYVQPLMSSYLARLQDELDRAGFTCPLLLMMSSGGMTTLETARQFPVRLVESGPAGGAILASQIAAECQLDRIVSFDMGGTTAKICLVDRFTPQLSRSFEVARHHRHLKGSGLPLRIPVIEMVEIGAGGGSIASVDVLGRVGVGPHSAGSTPGPVCYDRGGRLPTVTDSDLVAGRIDPGRFAGGRLRLSEEGARDALAREVGARLGVDPIAAACAISEVVDENMANAARVHCVESGKDFEQRAMVAFGGAAPLHAARVAEKLGIDRIVIPSGAGVGSAIGFLRAQVAYEVVRSHYMDLRNFDPEVLNALMAKMLAEAESVVRMGAPEGELVEARTAYMRYKGQGHEIAVSLPNRPYTPEDAGYLRRMFEWEYGALYGRVIPHLHPEVMTWGLALSTQFQAPQPAPNAQSSVEPQPITVRTVFDENNERREVPVFERRGLAPGAQLAGPAVIVEDETSTLVSAHYNALINALGYIVLTRKTAS